MMLLYPQKFEVTLPDITVENAALSFLLVGHHRFRGMCGEATEKFTKKKNHILYTNTHQFSRFH